MYRDLFTYTAFPCPIHFAVFTLRPSLISHAELVVAVLHHEMQHGVSMF